jgi:hypothetical protein
LDGLKISKSCSQICAGAGFLMAAIVELLDLFGKLMLPIESIL